jgi:hypothetical protein
VWGITLKWTIEIDQDKSIIKVKESSPYFEEEVYEFGSIKALVKFINDNIELKNIIEEST